MTADPRPMYDWYSRYYTAVSTSQANARYCQQVYGENLCQHGFAEMADLDHLIEVSNIKTTDHVLDLGCGNGMITEYIADKTGAQVTGIDFIAHAIQDARQRTEAKKDRLTFLEMDLAHLQFEPRSFDVVVSIDTLYFNDIYETLTPMLPLFKSDGRLAVFFDQSCGPEENLDIYPKESILPDATDLAMAFHRLHIPYQTWDYTQAMLDHLRRRRSVLANLKAQFEAEGNQFLYDNHLEEADGIERAYLQGAGKRYLYLASLP